MDGATLPLTISTGRVSPDLLTHAHDHGKRKRPFETTAEIQQRVKTYVVDEGAFAQLERERMIALNENVELKSTIMKSREDMSTIERENILLKAMLEGKKAETEALKLRISEMQTRQDRFEAENFSLEQEASISTRKLQEYHQEVETLRERVASIGAKVEMIRSANAVSHSLSRDAIIQTDEYPILAQNPLPSTPDADSRASSPGINTIHSESQTQHPSPPGSPSGQPGIGAISPIQRANSPSHLHSQQPSTPSEAPPAVASLASTPQNRHGYELAEDPSSDDHHQEAIAVVRRPRGRPRGTARLPQGFILPAGTKRLRNSKNT